jgi:hypothetical protein
LATGTRIDINDLQNKRKVSQARNVRINKPNTAFGRLCGSEYCPEGYALGTPPNYLRHLNISEGSLAETESHIEIAHDLGYLSDATYEKLTNKAREVGYLLARLRTSIENNTHKKP